jgi:hypothetical protein
MISIQKCKTALAMATLFAVPTIFAATLTPSEYSTTKDRISADYNADNAACNAQISNAKDVCKSQASGKEKIALAELEYNYTGKATDAHQVVLAKADSGYVIAKDMCGDKTGNTKDVCLSEAKATHAKALADATKSEKITDATTDARQTKRDADYSVAKQKCDSLSGDAQASCIATAKAHFNKS